MEPPPRHARGVRRPHPWNSRQREREAVLSILHQVSLRPGHFGRGFFVHLQSGKIYDVCGWKERVMMGSSPSLQARLEAKRVQIIMFLAKQGGKAIWDLTPADYQNLQTIADDQLPSL